MAKHEEGCDRIEGAAVIRRRLALAAVGTACLAIVASAGVPATARKAPAEFVFGVVPQGRLGAGDMRLMSSGGVESFRFWLNWGAVEYARGSYDWSEVDRTITTAAREGVTAFPFLFGSPGWVSEIDRVRCDGEDCARVGPRSTETQSAFALFAAAAARRYGPQGSFWDSNPQLPEHPIRTWQIWNEQNLTDFFLPQPDPRIYADLLRASSTAIRAVDPDAELVIGGMWGPRSAPKTVIPTARYLRRLYREPEIEESFDALGLHPYDASLDRVLDQIAETRRIIRNNGDAETSIWITELGWASGGPSREPLVKNRFGQARLLRDTFTKFIQRQRSWRIRGAFWYAWEDTPRRGAICKWCPRAGLHAVDGSAKPAWRQLTALARR
jgi:hypothetical protein